MTAWSALRMTNRSSRCPHWHPDMQDGRTGALTGVGPRSEKLSLLRNLAWRASAPGSWKPRREPPAGLSAPGDSSCSPRVADRRSGLAPDAAISSLLCKARRVPWSV